MATIAVTSALGATPGDYPVTFNVVNTKDEAYNVATQVTHAVAEQQTGSGDVVAVDDNVQMSKVSTVTINVLGNDIIADGVSVEISAMSAPSKGTVKLLSDGSINTRQRSDSRIKTALAIRSPAVMLRRRQW